MTLDRDELAKQLEGQLGAQISKDAAAALSDAMSVSAVSLDKAITLTNKSFQNGFPEPKVKRYYEVSARNHKYKKGDMAWLEDEPVLIETVKRNGLVLVSKLSDTNPAPDKWKPEKWVVDDPTNKLKPMNSLGEALYGKRNNSPGDSSDK